MTGPLIGVVGGGDDEFRAKHVGASEVAALFDASPYLTHFELWHRKKGNIDRPDFMAEGMPNNERIEWGLRLEPVVIAAASERYGYALEKTPQNLTNGEGLGGHPDHYAHDAERGPGILEVKTVDWLVRKKWGDEPPTNYLLQAMSYAGLAGRQWCDIIVLVGGNSLERFTYDFRPKIYAEIVKRVADFWASVRANDPPLPDFTRDVKTLADVLGEPTDEVIDLRHDNAADHLAAEFLAARADRDAAELRMEVAKCELLLKIGDAGRALLPAHRIGANMTKGSPDKEITAAMVGETIKGRKGYRRFDVKETEK